VELVVGLGVMVGVEVGTPGLGVAVGLGVVAALGVGVLVEVGALQTQSRLSPHKGLRQNPLKQKRLELQFEFEPQVPPQALVPLVEGWEVGDGVGVLVGEGLTGVGVNAAAQQTPLVQFPEPLTLPTAWQLVVKVTQVEPAPH
jgi:hypothetical protein